MTYSGTQLLWLFLCYSFLGWVLETATAAVRKKRFVNRGMVNGPFCVIYGIAAALITATTSELHGFWLFLDCVILATVIEWVAGHLIERWYRERWWNYENIRWNLDGYISLPTSLFWGALGVLVARFGNHLLLSLFGMLPSLLGRLTVFILTGLIAVDIIATAAVLSGRSRREEQWKATDRWLTSISRRLGDKIYGWVNRRIEKAYVVTRTEKKREAEAEGVFAAGCGFYKLVMLFIVGAFLGDITETIFCRITAGYWMSRSSVVWGPFSIVWGLAIAAATALLYRYRNRSDGFLFLAGTFLGGAYEYLCSVFTEIVFGTVFWDYSKIPFNLGGRINLLYCFFWGIAAVIWLKILYPFISGWIEKIPMRIGKILTWVLLIFMIVNMAVSALALARMDARASGIPAENVLEEWLDSSYNDDVMNRIYPNAKRK
ncbi:MAG: putative ABC transporter permease [Lachnospiraceae bacterium]